ncbi:hypothetical protein CVIRNUC_000147 [Coccomyxa viridis]|uniref:C2H2-type domain-containing protein n=1 Tax=Coccomyxa viridis TaxID=1274662 RepID=A0AAV1HPP2_9CHLO|nr:hypothetical protein CVIRNUC_000147 [Coccomyxa viridis]
MKRKADAAYACNICSRKGAPRSFASDAGLATHKRSASHIQQHWVALAIERGRSVAPPPLPATHAEHQQAPPKPQGSAGAGLQQAEPERAAGSSEVQLD